MDQHSASSHNSAHDHPYYYHHSLLYHHHNDDLQDPSPSYSHSTIYSSHTQPIDFSSYPPRQMQQQQQQQQHLPQNQLSFQRPHSHPPQSPTFPQHFPQPHYPPHEQLRHAHSQPSLPRVALSSHPYSLYDHQPGPSSRTARSSPESSTSFPDPMSYRDDLQIQAAATALAQATGPSGDLYAGTVPRLPPIMQVERHQVTTTATQAASAHRRIKEAPFHCPVPGCGSTFTRRFNLKGHLRSHTSERPFVCDWPGCDKAFARQHDCKRHSQLHSAKAGTHVCQGCGKSFSRTDALNRHLRSDGGVECRVIHQKARTGRGYFNGSPQAGSPSPSDTTTDGTTASEKPARSRPPSV